MRIPVWLLGVWLTLGGVVGVLASVFSLFVVLPDLYSKFPPAVPLAFAVLGLGGAVVSVVDLWWASRLPESLLAPQPVLRNILAKFALGVLFYFFVDYLGRERPSRQAVHFLINVFLYRSIVLLAQDARKPAEREGSGLSPSQPER